MHFYTYLIDNKKVTIAEENGFVVNITTKKIKGGIKKETPLIKKTHLLIVGYLNGETRNINVPYKIKGTEFQKKVYKETLNIKYGEVKTYKEIAILIDKPKSSRAVGNALSKNPLLFLIPCHRVIRTDGKVGGYSSLFKKEKLLKIELS